MWVWQWALENPEWLNLGAAFVAAAVGVMIYYLWRPPLFDQHEFTVWAFWFLIAQWVALIAVYIIILRWSAHQGVLLVVLDFQSLCAIAFVWAFLQGDQFKWRPTLGVVVLIWIFLVLWNSLNHPGEDLNLQKRLMWLSPSEAISAFAMPLVGFVFFLRYRAYAFPLFAFTLAYAAFQHPLYSATLASSTDISQALPSVQGILLILAAGKVVIAGLTYGLFFATVQEYTSAAPKLSEATERAIRRALAKSVKWTIVVLLTPVLIGVIVAVVTGWLRL